MAITSHTFNVVFSHLSSSAHFNINKELVMDCYMGTILPFAFNYAPSYFDFCNGQQYRVSQYQALFALLGKFYGGDGATTFNLPNLQGRIWWHCQCSVVYGKYAGTHTYPRFTGKITGQRHCQPHNTGQYPLSTGAVHWCIRRRHGAGNHLVNHTKRSCRRRRYQYYGSTEPYRRECPCICHEPISGD